MPLQDTLAWQTVRTETSGPVAQPKAASQIVPVEETAVPPSDSAADTGASQESG